MVYLLMPINFQLIGLVHSLSPRQVFLVHGQQETMTNLGKDMQLDYWGKIYLPANGESHDSTAHKAAETVGKDAGTFIEEGVLPPRVRTWKSWWRHILKHEDRRRPYSAEELFAIWYGKQTPAPPADQPDDGTDPGIRLF